ncbi:hypothetical protein ABT116_49940, partial [Streptomyces sp. NPDC002130]|uniref:hypothetical protein n=1 Tax=Streptomyces sp. NPDC002130 TaxID=3155568 RepID=UPI00331C3A21
ATAALFAESQSRFVITVKRENKEAFEKAVEAIQVGEVTSTNEVHGGRVSITLSDPALWNGTYVTGFQRW